MVKYTKEELTSAIRSSFSIAEVCQTDTYRKAKSALSEKIGVESLKVREGVHGNADINPEPSISQESDKACAETLQGKPKSKKPKEIHYCTTCGKPIPKSRKYCSVECYRYSNKGNRPDVLFMAF